MTKSIKEFEYSLEWGYKKMKYAILKYMFEDTEEWQVYCAKLLQSRDLRSGSYDMHEELEKISLIII